jgi:CubicO group peptidase (beta-lactamase class C family)
LPKVTPVELLEGFEVAEEVISVLCKLTSTSAASVGIVYDGKLIWGKGFDYQNKSDPRSQAPVNLDTPYRVGSISKVFTDTMLMMLKDQKGLNIDDPVSKYWPNFQPPSPFPPQDQITFRHLATQLSGLPMISPCNYLSNACNITTDQAFANMQQVEAILPTAYYPHYSDGAFAILGRALERIAGTSWENFLTENIINVHGMKNTGWDYPQQVIDKMPIPFMEEVIPNFVAFDDMQWARPTGGMRTSVNDLVPFLQMFLDGYNSIDGADGRILGSTLREMLLPRFINDDAATGFGFPFEWYYSKETKLWYITKGGFYPGYTAMILMVPKLNFGVISLSNDIAGVVLGMETANAFLPFLEEYLNKNQPPAPVPLNITSFVGLYVSDYAPIPQIQFYANISLSEDGSYLNYGSSGIETKMSWIQGNTFRFVPSATTSCQSTEIGQVYEYIDFTRDPSSNEIVSFVIPGTDPFWGVTWVRVQ